MTTLYEAATIRMRARGAARALRDLLKEKDLPDALREQVEGLYQAMGKTWAELANLTPDPSPSGEGGVKEAANVGAWFEGEIHKTFTIMADGWYQNDWLTREERIALSSGIGSALEAFVARVMEVAPELYVRKPFTGLEYETPPPPPPQTEENVLERGAEESIPLPEESIPLPEESIPLAEGEVVELVERAVRGDGTMEVKIIAPGWGSSGYYGPEVLERDGPRVFTKGLKMYWNHPTEREERERPEGDLNNLAAELVEDARWSDGGKAGPGLYATAKVFGSYKEAVEELAPHIGVSIRASGKGQKGTAEGREGLVLSGLVGARSVDFVTMPGAGGQVVSLFESKRVATPPPAPPQNEYILERGEGKEELSMEEREELERLRESVREYSDAVKRMEEEAMRRTLGELASVCVQTVEMPLPEVARSKVVRDLVEGFRRGEYGQVVANNQVDEVKLKEVIQGLAEEEWKYLKSIGFGVHLRENSQGSGSGIRGMGAAATGGQAKAGAGEDGGESALKETFMGMGLSETMALEAARGRQ